MGRDGRRRGAMAALCLLVGLEVAGCTQGGSGLDLVRLSRPRGPATDAGIAPDSPTNVLRVFEWSYNHRSVPVYRALFTEGFRFLCAPFDSAGNAYRGTPWTLTDELIFATHLFVGGSASEPPARGIQLALDRSVFVYPDPATVAWDPTGRWHRIIRSQAALTVQTADGNTIAVTGAFRLAFVRGDSALIPEDLRQRGAGADSTRWYIRLWEDETAPGSGPSRAQATVAAGGRRRAVLEPQPSSNTSWCELKVRYR